VPISGDGSFEATFETQEYEISISGLSDPDPFLSYTIGVVNSGQQPSTFAFSFFTSIVPTGPQTTVSASISGTLRDATGDGLSMTPVAGNSTIQQSHVSAPLTSMGVDVGDSEIGSVGLYAYGPFSSGPQVGPPGLWTGLQVIVSFNLSGNGDVASLTGITRVDNSVPDGGAGLFGALAIAGLTLIGRRVRR
jgi:hypothetical protein